MVAIARVDGLAGRQTGISIYGLSILLSTQIQFNRLGRLFASCRIKVQMVAGFPMMRKLFVARNAGVPGSATFT